MAARRTDTVSVVRVSHPARRRPAREEPIPVARPATGLHRDRPLSHYPGAAVVRRSPAITWARWSAAPAASSARLPSASSARLPCASWARLPCASSGPSQARALRCPQARALRRPELRALRADPPQALGSVDGDRAHEAHGELVYPAHHERVSPLELRCGQLGVHQALEQTRKATRASRRASGAPMQ